MARRRDEAQPGAGFEGVRILERRQIQEIMNQIKDMTASSHIFLLDL